MRIPKPLKIDKEGIYCTYKGDDIIYVWPWKQVNNYNCRWIVVTLFCCSFKILKDIDKFWEDWSNS